MLRPGDLEEPPFVVCRRFLTSNVMPGHAILDVGCGSGDLMLELRQLGGNTRGVEVNPALVSQCRDQGLDVRIGTAEKLPFADATFNRVVCSVVLPYTNERLAVTEWSRVLVPGGEVLATYHGLGYGLSCVMNRAHLKRRLYGMRMIANSLFYRLTRRRLPGFLGDTLCQSLDSLLQYYQNAGLVLRREIIASRYCGLPCFICHHLVKAADEPALS